MGLKCKRHTFHSPYANTVCSQGVSSQNIRTDVGASHGTNAEDVSKINSTSYASLLFEIEISEYEV